MTPWLKDVPTPLAIACLTGLAVLDMLVTRQSAVALSVVSGLLGWLSHKAVSEASGPNSSSISSTR